MDTDQDKTLDKIRKLLAKAEDPACTPEEAKAFNDKAAELIVKYGVDMALLAAAGAVTDIVSDRKVEVHAPFAMPKAHLLYLVAEQLGCRPLVVKAPRPGVDETVVHLFGYQSDLERVELLFTSLLVQAANALTKARIPIGENPAMYRRSWLRGFQTAIVERLKEQQQRAQAHAEAERTDGPSVALVLADRSDVVARAFANVYPRVRTNHQRPVRGSGGTHGYLAGLSADLGGTRVGSGSSRALSR